MIENADLEFGHRVADCKVFEAIAENGEGFEERRGHDLGTVLDA